MSTQAFGPRGNTANIACNASASTAVQITSNPAGCYTYQFVNEGASKCFFAWGNEPNVTVSIPVPGTPGNGVPVLSNEIVVYRLNPNIYVSAICESGGSTNLMVTPGEGM